MCAFSSLCFCLSARNKDSPFSPHPELLWHFSSRLQTNGRDADPLRSVLVKGSITRNSKTQSGVMLAHSIWCGVRRTAYSHSGREGAVGIWQPANLVYEGKVAQRPRDPEALLPLLSLPLSHLSSFGCFMTITLTDSFLLGEWEGLT